MASYNYQQQQMTVTSYNEEVTTEPTTDIFTTSKILVAIQPSSTSTANQPPMAQHEEKNGNNQQPNSSRLEIKYACGGFRQSFGYHGTSTIPFTALLGAATKMETLSKIEECILFNRRSLNVYMNLYTSDGRPLPCHLSVLTVRGDPELLLLQQQKAQSVQAAPSSESNVNGGLDSFNLDGSFGTVKAVMPIEKFAMISIRSSITVGHAKVSGMGYVGFCIDMYP